jgi:iron complex transport system substrate-binding protein
VIVTGQTARGASRAEDILRHPIVAALNHAPIAPVADRDWVCGTPDVLRAIAGLVTVRRGLAP